jgi:hypothetical protein
MIEILRIENIDTRNELLRLKDIPVLGINSSVVYIYYLNNSQINYPITDSCILYIGQACRQSDATGIRFSQHISTQTNIGGDTGSNLILSQYFHQGHSIGLKIFDSNIRLERERDLIYSHINLYGSPPIAQSVIPKCPPNNGNSVTEIFTHINNNPIDITLCGSIILDINNQFTATQV